MMLISSSFSTEVLLNSLPPKQSAIPFLRLWRIVMWHQVEKPTQVLTLIGKDLKRSEQHLEPQSFQELPLRLPVA